MQNKIGHEKPYCNFVQVTFIIDSMPSNFSFRHGPQSQNTVAWILIFLF